jgi:hypothetical protein
MHARMLTHTLTISDTRKYTHTHTHTHSHTHARARTYVHVHAHAYTHPGSPREFNDLTRPNAIITEITLLATIVINTMITAIITISIITPSPLQVPGRLYSGREFSASPPPRHRSACCLLPAACCCLLPAACCLLPAVYCLLSDPNARLFPPPPSPLLLPACLLSAYYLDSAACRSLCLILRVLMLSFCVSA